ncbi:MAG: FAD-dependent oxidoreductase [Desulfovibrionaceae bacterium]
MHAATVIVGAGILGLTLARELVARGARDLVLLDKESGPARHASGRNSGVLHAGIYYAPDSLRAKTCLAGNRLMKAYCRERGLPLHECGKVIE